MSELYNFAVISFFHDSVNEINTTALFVDFKDSYDFYEKLKESDYPCMLFSLCCFDNFYN